MRENPPTSPVKLTLAQLYWDLLAAALFGLALLAMVLLPGQAPASSSQLLWKILAAIRLVFGLVYVLIVPGYLLQSLLFPRYLTLDSLERLGLSLGLSISLEPALVLLLDRLPGGLSLQTVAVGQISLVVILAILAAWRRGRLPTGEAFLMPSPTGLAALWRRQALPNRRGYLFAGLALLLAGAAIAWVLGAPKDDEFYTEFYMLGQSGLAEEFPRQAQVGQPLQVTLGVASWERGPSNYHVEVWAVNSQDNRRQVLVQGQVFSLRPGEKQEWEQSWSMPWAGPDQQVEFLLYQKDQNQPYRRLTLWIKVEE